MYITRSERMQRRRYSSFVSYFLHDALRSPLGSPLNTCVTSVSGAIRKAKRIILRAGDSL